MLDRIVTWRTLLVVDAILLVLALASVGIAHIDLRGWNPVVALALAVLKATVIALFFMELKFAGPLPRLIGLVAMLWLAFLIVGTLDDFLTRDWLPAPGK